MTTLFELPPAIPPHPAKYTDILLPVFAKHLKGCKRILDPFGGTGKAFLLSAWLPDAHIDAIEIEPEWAAADPRITVGNALALPWGPNTFDAICTSPAYANRLSDHHEARDPSNRNTYRHKLGRPLHPDNTGQMEWGNQYRDAHLHAWREARRVLQPGGVFVLNCKNHIRMWEEQLVTEWHVDVLKDLGFIVMAWETVPCPGNRYGANAHLRMDHESVVVLKLTG